jgi:hypothetical protein
MLIRHLTLLIGAFGFSRGSAFAQSDDLPQPGSIKQQRQRPSYFFYPHPVEPIEGPTTCFGGCPPYDARAPDSGLFSFVRTSYILCLTPPAHFYLTHYGRH